MPRLLSYTHLDISCWRNTTRFGVKQICVTYELKEPWEASLLEPARLDYMVWRSARIAWEPDTDSIRNDLPRLCPALSTSSTSLNPTHSFGIFLGLKTVTKPHRARVVPIPVRGSPLHIRPVDRFPVWYGRLGLSMWKLLLFNAEISRFFRRRDLVGSQAIRVDNLRFLWGLVK